MNEAKVLVALLAAVLVFLISIFMSVGELRYAVFADQVDARVVQKLPLLQKNSRRSATKTIYEVTYAFDDGGSERKEMDTVDADWPFASDGTVAVQYIPGSVGSSRLAGHDGKVWIYVMLVCMAVLAFLGWRFWKFYKS